MTDERLDEARANFDYFTAEYSQALQAWEAIENQAATLLVLGRSDDLRQFIDQFIEMATRTKALADEKGETNFAEWFGELVARALRLRTNAAL